jgi:vacuolar-type H+-ATPase subunit C/Vma6
LEFKVSKYAFDEYKQYADHYVHKKDVDYLYNEIIPKVSELKESIFVDFLFLEVVNSMTDVEDFRVFIKKTDYNVLFKASKMDLELLEKKVN